MLSIAVRRLYNQQIARTKFKTPSEIVAWLGALQAQDYAGAKWSVGLRLPGSAEADIEQAIANKTIIRTWVMRGTLHFVAAADVRWMLALVAPRLIAGNARRYKELELDARTLARSNAVLAKAVQGGKPLTRSALFAILEQHGISTQGQRGVFMLQRASLDGLICQGVMRSNDPTFMSLDDVLPKTKTIERDDALAELAKRYWTSRGPATLQDFVWWSGLWVADARAGLEQVKLQFIQETVDDKTYWRLRSKPISKTHSPTAYLLPGFDEYLLGYKDRRASLDEPCYKRLTPPNGMLPSTIVIDGRVVGTWKRTFEKGAVIIASNPFRPLTAAERRALVVAAKRYGEFLGLPFTLDGET